MSEASKTTDGWIVLPLLGPALASGGHGTVSRDGVLSIQLLQANASIRITAVELLDKSGRQVLKNADLALGPRYWSSIAYGNFLPWHMDNLLLELLIERGLLAVLILALAVAWALLQLARGVRRGSPLALVVGGSIIAGLMAGGLISFAEVPRVSLVLWLLPIVSFCITEDR